MPVIPLIDLNSASAAVQEAIQEHLAQGYRLTNEKLTLLHNVTAFRALEAESYAVDRELQQMIGKRAADFYEYAISQQNDCPVCSVYFGKLMKQHGITDFDSFTFTEQEKLLMLYGRAIARDHKHVPDTLMQQMKETFSDEELVVITTMGVLMIANNYFNDILQVEPEHL